MPARPSPTMERTRSLELAVGRLTAAQDPDGWWRDFRLAPGPSDEWVTAYVATVLAEGDEPDGHLAARRAWRALSRSRLRRPGWGYNASTPCDADSTSWALRLAGAMRKSVSPAAAQGHAFLQEHVRLSGGIATYATDTDVRRFVHAPAKRSFAGWTAVHDCVTAAAGALPGFGAAAVEHLLETQRPDGSWSAYWWDGDAYVTGLAAEAIAARAPDHPALDQAGAWAAVHEPTTCFELAWTVIALVASGRPADDALARLVDRQRPDGSWQGDARLRLPQPGDLAPDPAADWVEGGLVEGAVVADEGLFTTASALRALQAAGA